MDQRRGLVRRLGDALIAVVYVATIGAAFAVWLISADLLSRAVSSAIAAPDARLPLALLTLVVGARPIALVAQRLLTRIARMLPPTASPHGGGH